MSIVYCIDTSAWIDLKEIYPFGVFPSLWNKLDTLIQNDVLISPHQVYVELKQWEDDVFRWVNKRKKLFRQLDEERIAVAKEVLNKFPTLTDPQKETEDADPFVIALAIVETKNLQLLGDQCAVVSQEKGRVGTKMKIPDVCNHYGIKHFLLIDFFNNEGWKF